MSGGLFFEGFDDSQSSAAILVSAAHEMKSPLALVRQLSLSIESGELSPSEIKKYARQISLTAERSLRLTTDLTQSANPQQSQFALEPINLKPILETVAHELEPLYRSKNRQIEISYGKNNLVLANRDLLRRVLINFADNALHYSFENSAVTLKTQTFGGDIVRCSVRDFGPALSLKQWRRINQGKPLQSLGGVNNRPQSSGLGLYIAEQFAQAMLTHIGTTRHRDGASFYIDLKPSSQLSLL